MQISQKKNIKECSILFKERSILFFDIYLYIYVCIYLYIFIYISIYISMYLYWKKNGTISRSFAKERNVLAFFSILCKRTLHSLRSFPFFCNVLLGLITCQKLEKRIEKDGTFFFKNGKECNLPNGKDWSAQPCPLETRTTFVNPILNKVAGQPYISLQLHCNVHTLYSTWIQLFLFCVILCKAVL